jgi:hypothetical protein
MVLPWYLVTTISQEVAATEMNEPGRAQRACQIGSTKAESDAHAFYPTQDSILHRTRCDDVPMDHRDFQAGGWAVYAAPR